jgi:hypothetical protein
MLHVWLQAMADALLGIIIMICFMDFSYDASLILSVNHLNDMAACTKFCTWMAAWLVVE